MNDDQQRDSRPKTFAEYMDEETRSTPAAPLYFAAPGLCIYGTAEQVTAMWAAVSEAQGKFPAHIEKDRKVTIRPKGKAAYSYRYAQLGVIKEATQGPLAEHGLAVLQPFSQLGGMPLCCRTLLTHREGAFMVSVVQREADHELKVMGGDTTYLQRYAYRSLFGLATDDDTDESGPEGGEVEVEAEDVIRLPNMKWLGEHAGRDITKCPDDILVRFADWQKGRLDPNNQYYESNKRTLAGIDALLAKREKAAAVAYDAAQKAEVQEGDPWGLAGDEPAEMAIDPKLLTAIGDAARELGLSSRKALSEYCQEKLAVRDYTAAVANPDTAKSLLTYLHSDISEREADRG